MNFEVRMPDPALYAAPQAITFIQSDQKGTLNFGSVTTTPELGDAQLNHDAMVAIALLPHLRQQGHVPHAKEHRHTMQAERRCVTVLYAFHTLDGVSCTLRLAVFGALPNRNWDWLLINRVQFIICRALQQAMCHVMTNRLPAAYCSKKKTKNARPMFFVSTLFKDNFCAADILNENHIVQVLQQRYLFGTLNSLNRFSSNILPQVHE